MSCPKCGCTSFSQTYLAFIPIRDSCQNTNRATCNKCGHEGLAWQFGAKDIPPKKGTENWTDEEVKKFYALLAEGKFLFHEAMGFGVGNLKCGSKLEIEEV